MRIILEYNESTGAVTDKNGIQIVSWLNVESFEGGGVPIESLIKLKNAGFSADEIVELARKELI